MYDHVVTTQSAFDDLIAELRASPRTESGGVLVGLTDPMIVLAAGRGGQQAVRQPSRFSQDVQQDEATLQQTRRRFGVGDICGAYHSHPGDMSGYSQTDNQTAQANARLYSDGKPYLCVIVTQKSLASDQPVLNVYGINTPSEDLRPFTYEIVADDSPLVIDAIAKAPRTVETTLAGFWDKEGFSFVENAVGHERIRREVSELQTHKARVQVGRVTGERGLRLGVRCRDRRFELYLPPEYPLSPPRIWVGKAQQEIALDCQRRWNSSVTLLALLLEALAVCACPRCLTQSLVPPVSR